MTDAKGGREDRRDHGRDRRGGPEASGGRRDHRSSGGGRSDRLERGPSGSGRPDRSGRRPQGSGRGGDGAPRGSSGDRTDRRSAREERIPEPPIDEGVEAADLDRAAKARLRTLSKDNAERVAQHLVMAGRLLDDEPERAYEHAQAAFRRAGRVDVVREAVALSAYALGNYAEALRELRTVRRLSGVDAHRAIEADCERGLGRPERALALAAQPQDGLSAADRIELAIVASGARLDLGEPEAALLALQGAPETHDPELSARLTEHTITVLEALGQREQAEDLRQELPVRDDDVVFLESDTRTQEET